MLAIRLILIVVGLGFLMLSLLAFIKKRISPGMGVLWVLVSIVLFVAGFLPVWHNWVRLVSVPVTIMVFILGFAFLTGLFLVCLSISDLISKNRELAMQVSLLNQENEQILRALEDLEREHKE